MERRGVEVALVVVGLMVIAGCTFAGADWSSGSLTNQLLFEPRRSRVWLAKAGAVTLGCGLVALVALGGFWLTLGVVAQARDIAIPSSDVTEVAWHLLRAVALAMGAGLGRVRPDDGVPAHRRDARPAVRLQRRRRDRR